MARFLAAPLRGMVRLELLDSGRARPVARPCGRKRGNNSVVECDLAKVEVAGSNPVSRSNLRSPAL